VNYLFEILDKDKEEQKSFNPIFSEIKTDTNISPQLSSSYTPKPQSNNYLFEDITSQDFISSNVKQTVADFRKDPEVQKDASVFLAALGKDRNADFVELLRDEEWSLTGSAARAFDVTNFNDEEKQAYIRLRNKFDNAELKSFGEKIKFAKDAAVDVLTDPFNLLTTIFAIPTLGQSFAGRAALGTVAQQGLKKLTASEAAKTGAKRLGIYEASVGAGWGGAYDYFSQSTDIGLDLQDEIDWGKVSQTAGIGAVNGGGIGGVAGAISGPMYLKKLYKHSNEDDIIKQAQKGTRAEV
jgi:hypothetical protein